MEQRISGGRYGELWDAYVEQWRELTPHRPEVDWPGDEWSTPDEWTALYARLFEGAEGWERAVELGPGAGKYTSMVLAGGGGVVHAFDVSHRYLDVCAQRQHGFVAERRLGLHAIDAGDPRSVLSQLEALGWRNRVDAWFSIDSMVHVDLQYLVAYLITAALTLRPDGVLVLTLADATTDGGFAKLVHDIQVVGVGQAIEAAAPGRRFSPPGFEWLSPDLVTSVLTRLGFTPTIMDSRGRDLEVRAVLTDPERALGYEASLVRRGQPR